MLLRHESRFRLLRRALGVTVVLLIAGLVDIDGASAQNDAGWDDLIVLDAELNQLRRPQRVDGVPQFGVDAMAARAQTIGYRGADHHHGA